MKFAEGGGGFNFDEGSWNNLKVGNIRDRIGKMTGMETRIETEWRQEWI